MKNCVYMTKTKTPDDLKATIPDVCSRISPSVIEKATEDVVKPAQYREAAERDIFEHVL